MATRNCTTYDVMPGEPQLGKMTECSIYFTLDEVLEEISQRVTADGEIPSIVFLWDQNDEEIEVEVLDWQDTGRTLALNSDFMTIAQYDAIDVLLEEYNEDDNADAKELQKKVYDLLTEGLSKKELFKTMEL